MQAARLTRLPVGSPPHQKLLSRLSSAMSSSPAKGASTTEGPYSTYKVDIDFECDPGRVDELVEATWDVISRVKANTAHREGIAVMQEQRRRDRETDARTNVFWADAIADTLMRGEQPKDLLGFEARNKAITGEAMRLMAVRVLNEGQYLMVIQKP